MQIVFPQKGVGGGGEADLPRSHTVYDDVAGTEGEQDGHLLDDEDLQQLRDVVAVAHVSLAFVVEGRKELARWRFAFIELGDLVELRGSHGEVGLCVVLHGRLAEFRVEEKGEQGEGDDVRGDRLFVILGHSELRRQYAGVGDEYVEAWQFGLDSVGKGLDGSIRAHVEMPHLEDV